MTTRALGGDGGYCYDHLLYLRLPPLRRRPGSTAARVDGDGHGHGHGNGDLSSGLAAERNNSSLDGDLGGATLPFDDNRCHSDPHANLLCFEAYGK